MKKDFNEVVQLNEPIQISLDKPVNLRAFYKDSVSDPDPSKPPVPLWNCDALGEILSLIPNDYAVDGRYELYLPVNKLHSIAADDFLPYIDEDIIDLNTPTGKIEAGNRLTILAHMLSLQPNGQALEHGLHPGGCGTRIGLFLFPSGKKYYISVSFHSDGGENGAWWFHCIESRGQFMDLGYWFAFSPKLRKLVNTSSRMSS